MAVSGKRWFLKALIFGVSKPNRNVRFGGNRVEPVDGPASVGDHIVFA
jgi:hypothetical protein